MCEKCAAAAPCDECGAGPGEKCRPQCLAPYGPDGPHEHDLSPVIVPLSENLAAPAAARAALPPDAGVPRPGDPVVIYAGHVVWLTRLSAGSPADEDNTGLNAAPLTGPDGGGAPEWTDLAVAPLDPYDPGIDEEDSDALASAWHALINHANTPTAA